MTLDQQLQLWNVVGTWVAGIATFAAVVVALYLARRGERVRLKVFAGLRMVVVGDGTPAEEHLDIAVTNLGDRPVTITSVGWAVGKGKNRRFGIQPVSGRWTNDYPVELAHGKQASFMVSFVKTPNWLTDFARGFLRSISDSSLNTLVAQVHTSVGHTVEVKPESDLLERLRKARKDG